MKNQLLTQIMQIFMTCFVAVITLLIKNSGDILFEYIESKKKIVEQKLKIDKHQEEINTAKQIWNIVEERFRITDNIEKLAKSKADEFDKLLLSKFPYLTQDEINQIRQSIAGEINKGKALLNEDSLKKQANEIVSENNNLKNENHDLKNKLDAISNYVPKENK